MNVPPFLESLLLSNEAVFKNASLGLSGQNFIPVPPGKTAVILELNVEPFNNFANGNYATNWLSGVFPGNVFEEISRRMMFQIQIINDNYNTHINYHNDFSLDWHEPSGGNSSITVNLKYTGRKDDLFIYTDRGLYFNFIYPYVDIEGNAFTGMSINYDTPANIFSPREQNLPPKFTTFYKSNYQDCVNTVVSNVNPNNIYRPLSNNYQIVNSGPQSEFFKLMAENLFGNPNPNVSIEIPVNSTEQLLFSAFFTLPLINIKYALINKRAEDYGIMKPKS